MMSATLTETVVCTIGYQGVTIDRFLRRLKTEGIQMIIDVRANPISRKPGFSKKSLSTFLGANGIKYVHLPQLGIPSQYRKKMPDYSKLFAFYEKNILPNVTDVVQIAVELCENNYAALLCFEEKPSECHRARLSKYMAQNYGLRQHHIFF